MFDGEDSVDGVCVSMYVRAWTIVIVSMCLSVSVDVSLCGGGWVCVKLWVFFNA